MNLERSVFVVFLIFLFASVSCESLQQGENKQSDLDLLLSEMTGSFSSKEQSEMDPAFYDIRLQMVQIWKDRKETQQTTRQIKK